MGKTWVLDTETKGTGAEMVPLEKVQGKSAQEDGGPVSTPEPKPWSAPGHAPRRPRRFKVWQPKAKDWRLLTLPEKKILWKFSRPDIISARASGSPATMSGA